jgi:penicillin-binding protein 1A
MDEPDDADLARWQADWDAWQAWRAWRRRQLRRTLLKWGVIAAVWGCLVLGGLLLWGLRDLPRPEAALDAVRRPSLVVEDSAGAEIATYGDVVGEPLRLTDLPPYLPQAAVAVEDRRYYQHGALDFQGIARATFVDLRDRRVVQGGSTIAQQVAKTLFLSNARTWRRKLQEVVLTYWLERSFTKQEILEIWLNRVYLGEGAWGVDAAAHVYFGISARRLNLWQSAMIAGLPRAPSRFNPHADPAAALARTKEVLQAMVESQDITQAQADAALRSVDLARTAVHQGGWFADWAAQQAQPNIPPDADAVVRSTLSARLQNSVEQRLNALLDGPGARAHVTQGAVVVMDAQSGAVRAMAGGRDYQASTYNRAVTARRQPGSAFKPFVWLAALEHGVSPDDPVEDAPIRIGTYAPTDFSRTYLGTITVEEALALSVNTAAVRLLMRAGGPRVVAKVAARLGIADPLPDNASLALGTGDVGLLEMAGAYAAFCNGGRLITPTGIEALTASGHAVALPPAAFTQVIAPDQDAEMQRMMRAVVTRGTGTAAAIPGHDVLGKTGTTQDFRDAWFIGCIDQRTIVATWLGNDDGSPMHTIEGGSLPAALFRQIGLALGAGP